MEFFKYTACMRASVGSNPGKNTISTSKVIITPILLIFYAVSFYVSGETLLLVFGTIFASAFTALSVRMTFKSGYSLAHAFPITNKRKVVYNWLYFLIYFFIIALICVLFILLQYFGETDPENTVFLSATGAIYVITMLIALASFIMMLSYIVKNGEWWIFLVSGMAYFILTNILILLVEIGAPFGSSVYYTVGESEFGLGYAVIFGILNTAIVVLTLLYSFSKFSYCKRK